MLIENIEILKNILNVLRVFESFHFIYSDLTVTLNLLMILYNKLLQKKQLNDRRGSVHNLSSCEKKA